jgi:transcription elongation GreA/GreB family factor
MKHTNLNLLYVLDEDKDWALKRIIQLEQAIASLGPEFNEVLNQSSETWHDNAPFDALRDKQAALASELQQIKNVLASTAPSIPRQVRSIVGIGARVTVYNKELDKIELFFIAGDWTARSGKTIDGAKVISTKAPLAQALLGKKAGEETAFRYPMLIRSVDYA